MAQFSMEEADNYGSNGSGSFFQLKNDKDKAQVRFLYRNMQDIKGFAVHRVEIGDKQRYVECLRSYDEPVEKCPLCASKKYPVIAKLFIKLFNEDEGEVQVWERGKTFFATLSDLCSHHDPLCNEVVEITRHGKKGDQGTTYTTYPLSNSEINLEDEQYDCADLIGKIMLTKTADEMETFLQTGKFEGSGSVTNNSNVQVQRRTPSTTRDDMPF